MKKITCFCVWLCACLLVNLSCSSPHIGERNINLIPAPLQLEETGGVFELDNQSSIGYSDVGLKPLAESFAASVKDLTGLVLPVEPSASSSGKIQLKLVDERDDLSSCPPVYGVSPKDGNPSDERYRLSISEKQIQIEASAPEGIFRGLSSLEQLVGGNMNSLDASSVYLPTLRIKDSPRFAWRGLSLDVSRCFYTVEEVKQVLDMLALYKMNVLHWHLTDNQGWRIEIKQYPKLTEVGGFVPNEGKPEGYYTQEQYKEIVDYAAERFITVVPELDMPGHTAAVFAAYPEFENAVKTDFKLNVSGQHLGALDVDDAAAMKFVNAAIEELAALTPGSYIHIGGDETMGLAKDKYARFQAEIRKMVARTGKKVVGWQETARADLNKDDLFQYWIHIKMPKKENADSSKQKDSPFASLPEEVRKMFLEAFGNAAKDLGRGIRQGAKVILSPSGFVYLDHQYLEPSSDSLQWADQQRLGLKAYQKQTVRDMYEWNPATYSPEARPAENIAGVEGAIWCETLGNFKELQFMLLPRLAGVAEKAWAEVEKTQWDEYKFRLGAQAPLWKSRDWYYFKSSLVDWKEVK